MTKAIISSTYQDNYFWNIPLVTFLWNKLGVDVICFVPNLFVSEDVEKSNKTDLVTKVIKEQELKIDICVFECPDYKEATYSQCLRNYASAIKSIDDETVLVSSDCDMGVFRLPPYISGFTIFGSDLVPNGQYPMCFISAKAKDWRNAFEINDRTYQRCIDDLLGDVEAEHYRGNFWARDQEVAFNKINLTQELNLIPRTNGQTPFAQLRLDREDAYLLERDVTDVYDFHLPRPGYEHFEKILTILQKIYPNDGFDWLVEYNEAYKKLL